MELLLEFFLQFFLEFVLQIVGEVIVEVVFRRLARIGWIRKTLNTLTALLLYFVLGLLTGWLSIFFFPDSFIRATRLHGISLLITPLLAGLTMSCIGWIRQRRGKLLIQLDTFAYGFVFAFAMALVRFLFTN